MGPRYRNKREAIVINRNNASNIGDRYSSPKNYFGFLINARKLDMFKDKVFKLKTTKKTCIIIGGGGLFGTASKNIHIDFLSKENKGKTIIWGAGKDNFLGKEKDDSLRSKNLDLVGTRDFVPGLEWVPCPSCMHGTFDKIRKIERKIVLYEHENYPIPIKGLPKMRNSEKSIKRVADFLGSSEIVITNSYHGAYWGTLLNKKVVIFDSKSPKFRNLKHPLPIANAKNWREKIRKAKNYPYALKECRDANLKFAEKVKKELNSKNKEKDQKNKKIMKKALQIKEILGIREKVPLLKKIEARLMPDLFNRI